MVKSFDNLGTRQRALNERVNEAVEKKVDFDSITKEPEPNDIDKLYKIDIAAKYKNVDYILDVLKSGDSLFTTRALKKCPWLFEDEFSHILNPTYLNNNVFLFTSMKMKRKILKFTAARVRNPERTEAFFHYCIKEKIKAALSFFLHTTEDFKFDQLLNNEEPIFEALEDKDITYFRFLVGKSFDLLRALLYFLSNNITEIARQFKNLFFVTEEKYLDIAEEYISIDQCGDESQMFDPKLSDCIMKRHKHRVLAKPKFYVNTVNTDVLLRNSTNNEIKTYATALLPDTAELFWTRHERTTIAESRIFEAIPHEQAYDFFQNHFDKHYPNAEFETHKGFYEHEYYKFLTYDRQEEWANNHLRSEKQILGIGRDYLFYKCINFNTAFDEIKRYISLTTDVNIRNEMVQVLIISARNDSELEKLFKYYSKRHINELEEHKEHFLELVLSQHNVFEFEKNTWTAFYELMSAMDQSNRKGDNESYARRQRNDNYKTIALLYNILHDNEMPEKLLFYLLDHFSVYSTGAYLDKIKDKKKQNKLHDYFFTFYMNETFGSKYFPEVVKPKWSRYFENINASMEIFNEHEKEKGEQESKEKQKRRRRTDTDGCDKYSKYNSKILLQDLKKNKELVICKLADKNCPYAPYSKETNTLLKKIKVYFPDDVTKMYLSMFPTVFLKKKYDCGNDRTITKEMASGLRTGVNAIFQLTDKDAKTIFINNYFSDETQTALKQTDDQDLRIQRYICRHACSSRPPISVSNMLAYMKTGGMKFCLPVLNKYLADLPLPTCLELVYSLTDTPVSIQKHAIRMAFQCINASNLITLCLSLWNNTKNVSLRSIVYRALYTKVVDSNEKGLYDVLKTLTQDLNQDDEDAVFEITVSEETVIPDDYLDDYISTVWETVRKLKHKEPNITRKTNVINYIPNYIQLINEEFIASLVNEHISEMFDENKLKLTYSKEDNIATFYQKKWKLTAHYIIHFACYEDKPNKYARLAQSIASRHIQCWKDMVDGVHVYQKSCWEFFNELATISQEEQYGDIEDTILIFQGLLDVVQANLKLYDCYLQTWEIQLILLTANSMKHNRKYCREKEKYQLITEIFKQFGEGLGRLVSDYVKTNTYFLSCSELIKKKIRNHIEKLLKVIHAEIDNTDYEWDEYLHQALITVANVLVGFEIIEADLLAILLLPTNCKHLTCDVMFTSIVNKLQEVPNAEVQLYLQQKFRKYCKNENVFKNTASCNIN